MPIVKLSHDFEKSYHILSAHVISGTHLRKETIWIVLGCELRKETIHVLISVFIVCSKLSKTLLHSFHSIELSHCLSQLHSINLLKALSYLLDLIFGLREPAACKHLVLFAGERAVAVTHVGR